MYFPVSTARTFSSRPRVRGSTTLPRYWITELPEITFRLGSWEMLLIKESVMPSLRYSVSGVPVMLVSGRIAMESIAVPREDR